MKTKVNFKALAQQVMFGSLNKDYIESEGLQWRKGRDMLTVRNSVRKAIKNGFGRTEAELGMLELYLKDEFKVYKEEN